MQLNDRAKDFVLEMKFECLGNGIVAHIPTELNSAFGLSIPNFQYSKTIIHSKEELLAIVAKTFDELYGA